MKPSSPQGALEYVLKSSNMNSKSHQTGEQKNEKRAEHLFLRWMLKVNSSQSCPSKCSLPPVSTVRGKEPVNEGIQLLLYLRSITKVYSD